eukprot:TRINITY_DN11168_c1_g1_i1.p1 TRINITY_DN11168_c1_g1~~TRINITY_DN11168_c1_g1_i1.p1  ORF type:complete len:1299 (+),score=186.70 TRINITY_DN11168_c1_g1_i1:72-3968(+)
MMLMPRRTRRTVQFPLLAAASTCVLPPHATAQCSTAANCSDRAQGVTFDGTACQCTCENGWGPGWQPPATYGDCSTCAPPYGLGKAGACDACDNLTDRAGFPACNVCTSAGNCSGHAGSVASDGYLCLCSCTNQWSDADCGTCPAPYNDATDCRCRNQWTGASCATCPASYGPQNRARFPTGDCDGCNETDGAVPCKPNYTAAAAANRSASRAAAPCPRSSAPQCELCDDAVDCSSHQEAGVPITSDGYRCVCSCRNSWGGLDCGTCPAPYGGADCDGCLTGTGCPSGRCGVGANESCAVSKCPPKALPLCRPCSSGADCAGHASAVTGDGYGCTCTCSNQWGGPNRMVGGVWGNPGGTDPGCSRCPLPYGPQNTTRYPSGDCDGCQEGWVGCPATSSSNGTACCAEVACPPAATPQCRPCAVGADCNGHAAAVTSDGYKCICQDTAAPDYTCTNRWEPPSCRTCPSPYGGPDCNGCVAGQVGCAAAPGGCCAAAACPPLADPQCRPCSVTDDCSGNAYNVTSDGFQCSCSCRNQWSGADCSVCPVLYGGDDCDGCASPGVGCPGPAAVTPCPRAVLPPCRVCTVEHDCSGNAFDVSSDGYKCVCKCRNSWQQPDCSLCPAPLGGIDCNGCVAGYVGCSDSQCPLLADPKCRLCSSARDCSGHAALKNTSSDPSVPDEHWITSDGYNCNCTCSSGWSGRSARGHLDCSACGSPFTGTDCDRCIEGYKWVEAAPNASVPGPPPPPVCVLCDSAADCSAHDVNGTVTSDGRECCCTCRNGWEGTRCGHCAGERYTGDDCERCADSAEGRFPLCLPRGAVTLRAPAPSSCPAGLSAAELTLDCSQSARAAAQFYYARRGTAVAGGPEVLWYLNSDGAAGMPDGGGGGCLRRVSPQELDTLAPLHDPSDSSHVAVCRAVDYGLTAEYFSPVASGCSFVPLAARPAAVVRTEPGVFWPLSYNAWRGLSFADNFAAQWVGYLEVNDSGSHTFALGSDDGAQLWVDGTLVVDNGLVGTPPNAWEPLLPGAPKRGTNSCHAWNEKLGRVGLKRGTHHLLLRYFEGVGLAGVTLRMRGPRSCGSSALHPVPFRQLRPVPTFVLSYATATPSLPATPTLTAVDPCLIALPMGSTFCREGVTRSQILGPWLLLLCSLCICAVACYVPARAVLSGGTLGEESRPLAAAPASRSPPAADPPAIPDDDAAAVGVRVSPRRDTDVWGGTGAAQARSPQSPPLPAPISQGPLRAPPDLVALPRLDSRGAPSAYAVGTASSVRSHRASTLPPAPPWRLPPPSLASGVRQPGSWRS